MHAAVTMVAALVGAWVFDRLEVPAGALLGAVAGVILVNVVSATEAFTVPAPARFLAFAVLGWAIGEGVTRETLRELSSSLPVVGIVVVVLVVVGAAIAWLLTTLGLTDANTAYLTTSPGALSQMAALAADTNADSLLVTTTHTVRVIAVVLIAPLVTNWLAAAPVP